MLRIGRSSVGHKSYNVPIESRYVDTDLRPCCKAFRVHNSMKISKHCMKSKLKIIWIKNDFFLISFSPIILVYILELLICIVSHEFFLIFKLEKNKNNILACTIEFFSFLELHIWSVQKIPSFSSGQVLCPGCFEVGLFFICFQYRYYYCCYIWSRSIYYLFPIQISSKKM